MGALLLASGRSGSTLELAAQKLFGSFGGPGIDGTAGIIEQIGLRRGKLHARTAGTFEFLGGLLIALGIVTPFAAAALALAMRGSRPACIVQQPAAYAVVPFVILRVID